jgi:hypothetical protein
MEAASRQPAGRPFRSDGGNSTEPQGSCAVNRNLSIVQTLRPAGARLTGETG